MRTLIDNDEALQEGILTALEQYNTEQLITVKLPGSELEVCLRFFLFITSPWLYADRLLLFVFKVIVSSHGKTDDDRYLDPRSKQTFKFDHMRLVRIYIYIYD